MTSKGRSKEKEKATVEPQGAGEVIMIKTTWRMSKTLLKQLKQYGLDNDMTLQEVAMKAFNDLLANES